MTKKLLGLAAALGITALASWTTPAFALSTCTGRVCGGGDLQCVCPPSSHRAGQVFSCMVWLQNGPATCN